MSDVTSGILIAISSAAGIYLFKKVVECVFPHHVKLKCYINPTDRNMPNITFPEKYEEYNIDNNLPSRYIKKEKCYDNFSHEILKISIPKSDKNNCHLFRTIYQKPETGHHHLRLRLKDVSKDSVFIFLKSYKTEGNNKYKGIDNGWEQKKAAINGINIFEVKSRIGEDDCDKEQVGVMVLGNNIEENNANALENGELDGKDLTCTILEACYQDKMIKICTLFTNYCSLFYRCYFDFDKEHQSEN